LAIEGSVGHGFRHTVVQHAGDLLELGFVQRLAAQQPALRRDDIANAAFDAAHRGQTTVMRDVGRLAGPGGDRTETGKDTQHEAVAVFRAGLERCAVIEQTLELTLAGRIERRRQPDVVLILTGTMRDRQAEGGDACEERSTTDRGRNGRAGKMQNGGHCVRKWAQGWTERAILPSRAGSWGEARTVRGMAAA